MRVNMYKSNRVMQGYKHRMYVGMCIHVFIFNSYIATTTTMRTINTI